MTRIGTLTNGSQEQVIESFYPQSLNDMKNEQGLFISMHDMYMSGTSAVKISKVYKKFAEYFKYIQF